MGLDLPGYPWDGLAPFVERARSHPDGIVDLSIGTPVDPTPEIIAQALAGAADAHGYPRTQGSDELRRAIAGWFRRRRNASAVTPAGTFPTIGSKELVAWLPTLLGLGRTPGREDLVVHPHIAYPTYDMGARIAGVRAVPADDPEGLERAAASGHVGLIWVNSPSNPTGRVRTVDELRAIVAWARAHGAVVCSDECYAELGWEAPWDAEPVPSLLDDRVTGGDLTGLLSAYSVSKQSNLAGYRAALVAGDPDLVAELINVRKHAGMIVPAPVQAAMVVALGDDAHVAAQRKRYAARRELLLPAVRAAGLRVDHSEAGLYLWATEGRPALDTLGRLADLGILVGPGTFYGEADPSVPADDPLDLAHHVRISLTATDERVAAAAERLRGAAPRER